MSDTTIPDDPPRAHSIPHASVPRVRWGDEGSGFVSDWVYWRSPQLVAIVFSMPPGGSFKVSDDWMPRYDAQECQYVLGGEYTIHNPTTGEIRVARAGEAVSFGRMSWHYGYNFADVELRVIEWLSFSSDRATDTATGTRPERELEMDPGLVGRFPEHRDKGAHRIDLVDEATSLRAILGSERQLLAAVLTTTPMLSVAIVEVPGAHRSDRLCHDSDTLLLVERGKTHVYVPSQDVWAELGDLDAFFVPSGVGYHLLNQTERRSRVIIATTGPSVAAPAGEHS
jgi:mannose-6-phosphate isomerase-like protein (cupin superfamily)